MDYTKSLQTINIPTMSIDKGRMLEIDHIKSAVTLLVHFKYVLFYMKEHYFIDIDYKIDTLSPQLKTDLDRCLLLYNELLQSSKYLNFVHNRENNYQTKSPIYTTFKTDRLDFQPADPAHELNIELQNLYQSHSQYVTDNGVQVQVQRNLNTQFEQNQMDQNFRPLNEYNEYFQTISLAPTQVGQNFQNNFQTTTFVPNQVAGTSAGVPAIQTQQQAQPPKQAAKPKRSAAAGPRPKKEKKPQKKRKRVPEEWKRNKAKTLRNSGMEYISIKKKVIPAKKLQPPCVKCMQKCNDKINEEQRREIFAQYWALPNINMKRMYLASCITQIQPKYRYPKGDSNRKLNNAFHFKLKGKQMRVCKLFFLNTLDINNRTIQTVIKKLKSTGVVEEDRRGRRPKNKQANTSTTAAETSSAADLSKTLEQASAELSQAAQISELSQHAQQSSQHGQQSELSQSQQLLQTAEMGQTPGNQSMN